MDETTTLFSEIPITSDVAADVIDVAAPVPTDMGSMPGGIQNTAELEIWQMSTYNDMGESLNSDLANTSDSFI